MSSESIQATVLGAGSWGTALATLLARNGHRVRLWGRDAAQIEEMSQTRENQRYLPGVPLPEDIEPVSDLRLALQESRLALVVTPSRTIRALCEQITDSAGFHPDTIVVSCTKGLEHGTGLRISEILSSHFLFNPVAVLSGPSHAEEVSRGAPTAVVIGAPEHALAEYLQRIFNNRSFRTYTSDDVAGMELGGALKNIFAIAAGICDGLGLGDNTKAALVTRSLAELIRLGTRLGGERDTFQGLSGIGDLMVTCFSRHSRNRHFGERLGKGESVEQVTNTMRMVAEGVPTTRSGWECAQKLGVEAPVTEQMYRILYEGKPPGSALTDLMMRDPKREKEQMFEGILPLS